MKKVILILLFAGGLAVRLYRLEAPLADWHSFRQADTASVAWEFVKNGYNLFQPKYHDLSNIQSGQPNPQGYRMVEFPLYNALHGLTYQLFGQFISFEIAGRLVTIAASLISGYLLFLLLEQEFNWLTGVLASGFFLFLPFNIFYSRVILPGPLMVTFSLASIYFLSKFETWLGLIFGMLAVLVKPYAIFLLLPSLVVINLKEFNFKSLLRVGFYGLVIILPLIGWRLWIKQFSEGIPANQWLLNNNNIRFRPAWWRWLFNERLGQLILGSWGLIPFGIGLINQIKSRFSWLVYGLLGGTFLYLSIFAWGNVQHDYYQIIVIPVVAIFLAKGSYFLIKPPKNVYKLPSLLLLVTILLFSFGFSFFEVKEYYKINHPEVIAAGERAKELIPEEAKVIAPYQGNTVFLYQMKRKGWPAVTRDVEELIRMGADYYVAVNYDQTTDELKEKCQVIEENGSWIIIKIDNCQL